MIPSQDVAYEELDQKGTSVHMVESMCATCFAYSMNKKAASSRDCSLFGTWINKEEMKKALWQKHEAGVLQRHAAGAAGEPEASASLAEPAAIADSDAVDPRATEKDDSHEGEEEEPQAQDGEVDDVE